MINRAGGPVHRRAGLFCNQLKTIYMDYYKLLIEPDPGGSGAHVVLKGDVVAVAAAMRGVMAVDPRFAASILSCAFMHMHDMNIPISDLQSIAAANGFFTGKNKS